MSDYRINKVHFKIQNPKIKVWVSQNSLPEFQKKDSKLFKETEAPSHFFQSPYIYFSYLFHADAIEMELNIEEHKYFLKPYVDFHLNNYFTGKSLTTHKTF